SEFSVLSICPLDDRRSNCRPIVDVGTAATGLRHLLTPNTSLQLEAGFAAADARGEGKPSPQLQGFPLITATLANKSKHQNRELSSALSARISPVVSQLTGTVDQRFEVDASADWTNREWTLHGLGRGSDSVPNTQAGSYLDAFAELSAGYTIVRA